MPAGDNNSATGGGRTRIPRPSALRIRTKLGLMLLVPLLALAGIVSLRLADSSQEASGAARTAEIAELNGSIATVINALQNERVQAALWVYGEELDLPPTERAFEAATSATDTALDALNATRRVFNADAEIIEFMELADKPLSRLDVVRSATQDDIAAVHLTVYHAAINRLTAVLERSVDLADTAELSRNLRAVSLLNTANESSERLRLLALDLESDKPLDSAYRPIMSLATARDIALEEYRRISADGHLAATFEYGGLGGHDTRPANTFERSVVTSRSDAAIEIDHAALMEAYDARHEATTALIDNLLGQTVAGTQTIQESVTQRAVIEVAIVVATLVVALAIALALGRSVTQGLRRLRDSAHRIATSELPTAVRQVDEHQDLTSLSPEEFADQTTPPLTTQGADELAEVATAFNQVHREAIRVAAQQAMLRVHIGSMFVRLARRGHSLTGRLTAELDAAEREEQDPDNLARLFRLDHLVSLQARANDSLLVLGGASVAKVRSSNASVADVLKAAQSHIEYYARINFDTIDDGVWVKANLVDDTVQLLAELMDNATRYSTTAAYVAARFLSDKVVIQIRDYGIGIKPAQLDLYNARLSASSPLDLDAFQAMGLTVVGLLASRNDIEVSLRQANGQGTLVEVVLPMTILEFQASEQPQQISAAPLPEAPTERREAPLFRSDEDPEPSTVPVWAHQPSPAAVNRRESGSDTVPIIHFDSPGLRDRTDTSQQVAVDTDGLPQRQPMSNLVPGEAPTTTERAKKPIRRDPASIGATYVAYARGLTGGRTGVPTQRPEDTSR